MPQHSPQQHPEYRPDIDGLRGIAVLAVVVFHAFPRKLPGGFVGVDVFFVISGFLITGIVQDALARNRFSFLEFYARRARRLFPSLVLVLIAVWLIGWRLLLIDDYQLLGKHIAASAAFIPNLVFWKEVGYFDVDSGRKVLLHLWSLGVEEQYYLVWPALLFFLWKRQQLLAITFCLLLLSFLANLVYTATSPTTAFYLPTTRFWELLIGSILVIGGRTSVGHKPLIPETFFLPSANKTLNDIKSTLGLALVVLSFLLIRRSSAFPGWWALLPTLGTALIISSGAHAYVNRSILSNRALVYVGLISYPLYLWHWPLLSFMDIALRGDNTFTMWKVLAIGLAFALAWITYQFFEKPIRFGPLASTYTKALIAAMIGLFVLGIWSFQKAGFPSRFSDEIVSILSHDYDIRAAYRYKRCLLDRGTQSADSYATECIESEPSTLPLLFLWGDSHAAHLYPGLKALQDRASFRIAQFTGCAFLDRQNLSKKCRETNNHIKQIITEQRPQIVVISMRWSGHSEDLEAPLSKEVAFLRANGVQNIVIVGPPPQWAPDLKSALAYQYFSSGQVPMRLKFGLVNQNTLVAEDTALSRIAKALNVIYVSPLSVFCTEEGCLARLDRSSDGLVMADIDHFSVRGSRYLFETAWSQIDSLFKKSLKTDRQ